MTFKNRNGLVGKHLDEGTSREGNISKHLQDLLKETPLLKTQLEERTFQEGKTLVSSP